MSHEIDLEYSVNVSVALSQLHCFVVFYLFTAKRS